MMAFTGFVSNDYSNMIHNYMMSHCYIGIKVCFRHNPNCVGSEAPMIILTKQSSVTINDCCCSLFYLRPASYCTTSRQDVVRNIGLYIGQYTKSKHITEASSNILQTIRNILMTKIIQTLSKCMIRICIERVTVNMGTPNFLFAVKILQDNV